MDSMKGKDITFDIRQKIVAASTSLGWKAPHVSYIYEADATGVMAEFEKIKKGEIFALIGRILGLKFGKDKLKKIGKHERAMYKSVPKEMRLCNDDLNLGTITISNMGAAVSGTNGFPALIDLISPQIMAIGIGTLQEKPLVYNAQITPRKIIPFCIVFDHCALDFGDVASLIKEMDSVFRNPEIIHTWRY